MHTIESVDHLAPASAVTKNCDRWLTFHRHYRTDECFADLRAQGFTIISTHLSENAKSLDEIDFSRIDKIALCFGNERRGVSQMAVDASDICAVLPMAGFSQSFNISVAAALFLAHMRHAGKIKGDLPPDELHELYLRWLINANKAPKQILQRAGFADQVPWL